MFEHLVQGYALNTAPSTVIPVGVSIEEAKKTYHLEHVDKLASNENPNDMLRKLLHQLQQLGAGEGGAGGVVGIAEEDHPRLFRDGRRKTVENNAEQRLRLTQELRQMGFRVCDSQANFLYVDFHMKPGDLYFALLPYGIMVRGDFSMVRISKQSKSRRKCRTGSPRLSVSA